jgi:predicted site-specific integrase-resolvase
MNGIGLDSGALRVSDVATRYGITRQRVAKLSREGKLGYVTTPLGRVYLQDEVERLARERARRARSDRRVKAPAGV